jgi:hypothetical protein
MIQIVGIDCASKPEKTGIAIGEWKPTEPITIKAVLMGEKNQSIADLILSKIDNKQKTLFAIDAPLGWSSPMLQLLKNHSAGDFFQDSRLIAQEQKGFEETQHRFFRRITDTFIHQEIGKLPLEVGADRIARAAYAALYTLHILRRHFAIQMLWGTDFKSDFGVIEVYPSATLKQYKMLSGGYKGNSQDEKDKRKLITEKLNPHFLNLQKKTASELVQGNADRLDAVICLLSANDFLEKDVYEPLASNLEVIKQEGWIWVKKA